MHDVWAALLDDLSAAETTEAGTSETRSFTSIVCLIGLCARLTFA